MEKETEKEREGGGSREREGERRKDTHCGLGRWNTIKKRLCKNSCIRRKLSREEEL